MIVIVDDDESFRRATASFIRSLGYSVLQFASAQTFLKSDYLDNTDCVISDVQMPGMNGIELQAELIAQGRRLPIIFVTAFPEMNARARALTAVRYRLSCPTIQRCGTDYVREYGARGKWRFKVVPRLLRASTPSQHCH